jgi:succinate dehydrogenase / fumarate reductase membrane anchor subunit
MRHTNLRIIQLATGVGIVFLLGVHMVVLHLNNIIGFFGVTVSDPTGWDAMINRARQASWAALYIGLLAFGLFHALYGLRGIILEVSPSSTRAVNWSFTILGIIIFIGTSYVPLALLSK